MKHRLNGLFRTKRSGKPVGASRFSSSSFVRSNSTRSDHDVAQPNPTKSLHLREAQRLLAQTGLDPHKYTSGRWLDKESARMRSRQVDFDFPALLQAALDVTPGAQSVIKYEKLEGGFNRAFILHLDNGSKIVARIPYRDARAPRLTTHSEVATLSYVRANTSIPAPVVLGWDDNPDNPVRSEYIIMEHVEGAQLVKHWPKMDPIQHFDCVRKLTEYMKELSRLPFPAYGSLYFDTAPIPPSQKIPLGSGFCIGPSTSPEFWPGSEDDQRFYSRRSMNRGPWIDFRSYAAALINSGYSILPESETYERLEYMGPISEHIQLLEQSSKVLEQLVDLPLIRDLSNPALLHHDYHRRNIFVSDSEGPIRVTAIIDWQFTSIAPLSRYANDVPDFVVPHDTIDNLVTAEISASAPDEERKHRAEKITNRFELLQKAFTAGLQGWIPQLWKARSNPTLLRFFDYCGSSYRDGATALRGELINLSQQWSQLGLPDRCPYQATQAELERHSRLEKDHDEAMRLKAGLVEVLGCDVDGWVPNEDYEVAKQVCHDGYTQGLEVARQGDDPDMDEDKFSKLWPFDAR